MVVYKFGGASIATPELMKGLLPIIHEAESPLLLVVSALGKTTNALEKITTLAHNHNTDEALQQASGLMVQHLEYARGVLNDSSYKNLSEAIALYFTQLENVVVHAPMSSYDHAYDQIVSLGELLSSLIFSHFLLEHGINSLWADIRPIIRTDATYRNAVVNWDITYNKVQDSLAVAIHQGYTIVTQGFIGSSLEGGTVTLGREGSDYTAAMLAAMLMANGVTIWKDVEGLLNADPKQFTDTVKIDKITYTEVIEMAYYGAQIIHPKTIKPLQNASIPLYVKCFADRRLSGTVIADTTDAIVYPPLIVRKDNQLLLQVTTRDFSFVTEDNLSKIYRIFHFLKIKVNLMQNAAISFVACIDNNPEKVKELIKILNNDYKVLSNENVSLLTIRYYTPEIVTTLTKDRLILLKQETRKTLQVVMTSITTI